MNSKKEDKLYYEFLNINLKIKEYVLYNRIIKYLFYNVPYDF